jgi:hypothetical protein
MLAGTDGLPPWLDIDRFHVSCRPFTPYPTAMVQGSVHSLLVKEDIRVGTTSPTLHVTVVAPSLLPLRESGGKSGETSQTSGGGEHIFIPFS